MKFFLLLGGFFGFFVVFASGVSAGNDLSDVLRNATVGCVCGALLMRGFRMLLVHQIRQAASEQERLTAETAAATQE
jgi:uncharacterized membrane protein YjfL (UPF0719 family)